MLGIWFAFSENGPTVQIWSLGAPRTLCPLLPPPSVLPRTVLWVHDHETQVASVWFRPSASTMPSELPCTRCTLSHIRGAYALITWLLILSSHRAPSPSWQHRPRQSTCYDVQLTVLGAGLAGRPASGEGTRRLRATSYSEGLSGYSIHTTPAFLRWTPRTVLTSTPREYGTWTLVPMRRSWAASPPPSPLGGLSWGRGRPLWSGGGGGGALFFEGRRTPSDQSSDSKCILLICLPPVLVAGGLGGGAVALEGGGVMVLHFLHLFLPFPITAHHPCPHPLILHPRVPHLSHRGPLPSPVVPGGYPDLQANPPMIPIRQTP